MDLQENGWRCCLLYPRPSKCLQGTQKGHQCEPNLGSRLTLKVISCQTVEQGEVQFLTQFDYNASCSITSLSHPSVITCQACSMTPLQTATSSFMQGKQALHSWSLYLRWKKKFKKKYSLQKGQREKEIEEQQSYNMETQTCTSALVPLFFSMRRFQFKSVGQNESWHMIPTGIEVSNVIAAHDAAKGKRSGNSLTVRPQNTPAWSSGLGVMNGVGEKIIALRKLKGHPTLPTTWDEKCPS